MSFVLIHNVIIFLHFTLFPSRGVVGVTLFSFLTSSWVAVRSLWFSPRGRCAV